MFSNRGEEQFAPHETMAVEHFAEIFFAPGGLTHSLHKLQGEIQNSQALPVPKTSGNLLVGIHLR
jgi:hypothetical protein